jgi:acyl carrier protein
LQPENQSEPAIRDWCVSYLARMLDLQGHQIDPDATFARLGLDSANSLYLLVELEEWLGVELAPDLLSEYRTISDLARHLAARTAGETDGG